jgi:DNA polymerase-3 subunit delta'
MAFETLKQSQPQVIKLLENSIQKDRVSHAYLFEGEKGTKKFEMAQYFAMRLLCVSEDKPCGTCKNCRRIAHNTHPNVYVIEPERNMIKKQQIVDLQAEFNKTSIEPGPKIYIIRNIETIHPSAANSLLKFLEEPHPNIHAILTTENSSRLLSTIISRSQLVQFKTLNKDLVKQELIEEGYPSETAHIISNITTSTSEAFNIASNEYFLEIVDLVKTIFQLLVTKEEPLIIYFNENSSIIYQDTELSKLFIQVLAIYQKDIIDYHIGNMYEIAFEEEMSTITTLAKAKDKNRLIDELEDMLTLQRRLNTYINQRLAFENILLTLERR